MLVHGTDLRKLPKPERFPKGRRMTIIAGFRCKDGILICADREESVGTSKKDAEKLFLLHASPWNMTVATAGHSGLCDLAVKRLIQAFLRAAMVPGVDMDKLEEQHEQIIIDVLTKIHEDHIWKNPKSEDYRIRLIVGLSFLPQQTQHLYLTQDNIPQPISRYCCEGYGADLCTYFSDRLYRDDLNLHEIILLAAFIFREVNDTVQFCGGGTDMTFLRPGALGTHISPQGFNEIQREIPEFADVTKDFWESTANLPGWVGAIGAKLHIVS